MLFKMKSVFNEMDLGIIDGGGSSSKGNTLYDWLNEEDEENEDDE